MTPAQSIFDIGSPGGRDKFGYVCMGVMWDSHEGAHAREHRTPAQS